MALKPLNSVGGFSVGEIPANVILANADITANKGTFVGNVAISNTNPAYGVLTDNLYYSNGQPWDLQQAAGNTGEIQFNNSDDFAASANFVWDNSNSNLNITGNANISGTVIAGAIEVDEIKNGTSNLAIPVTNGNVNISVGGTPNVLVTTTTGVNVTGTLNATGNANVGNIGTATAVITTGNITTINSGLLQNGTTNVTLTSGGNVATYIAGNATAQFVVAATGVNVAGYANIIGNANIGNIGTAELVATGNISGANLMGPLANGTSNVSIPAVNGNVNTTVGGVANVQVVASTGVVINGNLDTTGNVYLGLAGDNQLISLSNTALEIRGGWESASSTSVNIVAGDYPNSSNWGKLSIQGNVSGNSIGYAEANYFIFSNPGYASGNVVKVDILNPAATSTSTGAIQVTGGIGVTGNGHFGGQVVSTGNVTGGNIITAGNIFANTGNIVGANLMGPLANGTSNVYIPTVNGNVNISVGGTPNVLVTTTTGVNVAGTLNATGNANVGNLGTATAVVTTGNITTINSGLLQNGSSNVTLTSGGNISTFIGGNATAQMIVTGTGVNVAGTFNAAGNANLGNLGTAQITTTGNISISNATATNGILTDNLYYANGQPWDIGGIPGGANRAVQYNLDGEFAGSANFTFDEDTNVLDVNGNIDVSATAIVQGNVQTPGINAVGNLTVRTDLGDNDWTFVFTDTGNIVMPGNAMVINNDGNISIKSGAAAKYAELLSFDANTAVWVEDAADGAYIGANLTGTPATWNFKTNGDLVTNPGNITIGANGNIVATTFIGDLEGNVDTNIGNTYVLFSDDGQISGATGFTFDKISNLFATPGNLDVADALNVTSASFINTVYIGNGNISGGANTLQLFSEDDVQLNHDDFAYVAATATGVLLQANSFQVTLDNAGNVAMPGNLSVVGNIANANNISVTNELAAVIGNFSGNITSLNANLGNLVDANIIRTGELYNGNSNIALTANGNILFSVTGLANVHKFSNVGVNVVGYVEANGNGTFGAVYSNSVTAQGGNLELYSYQTGDTNVILHPHGTGTVDVNNTRITSLADPIASTDAATKYYVDTVAEGLDVKDSVHAASYAAIANAYTYNNGTSGVGATLTANQNGILQLDGQTILLGERVLIKNETGAYVNNTTPSAAFNGIYECTTEGTAGAAWVLTRTTDFDQAAEMYGAFTFIETGTNLADTGWVCINNLANPITVGTTQILWTQFSGAGTYQAGSGLTLTGTVFSVNVDNITTEINGGNVIVKASAQLTTPNIGAATGTSLDLTGNALVNNLNSNLKVTTTDLEATGNIIAANISANANLLVNNATINLALSGNTANFTGNVILPNLTVNLELAGNTANFTGNLIAANIQSNALANVGNLNVVANVTSDLLPNANLTLDLGASAQRWDNVYAGNIDASGNLNIAGSFSANTLTGNVIHANNQVEIGNTKIIQSEYTSSTTSANQTIATFTQSGITGVEYLVKAVDATGSKYTVATVVAVTDGANVDYSTFATVMIGGTTGTLSVNINGSNIDLQVTPASSNTTNWVTQYRTI